MQEKTGKIRLTVRHSRAARGLLGWTVEEVAKRADISPDTIVRWENGRNTPRESTRDAIRQVYEDAGIEFSNGNAPGVKLYLEGKNAQNWAAKPHDRAVGTSSTGDGPDSASEADKTHDRGGRAALSRRGTVH